MDAVLLAIVTFILVRLSEASWALKIAISSFLNKRPYLIRLLKRRTLASCLFYESLELLVFRSGIIQPQCRPDPQSILDLTPV